MVNEEDLAFEINKNQEMLDDEGEIVYCDNEFCEFPASKRVVVSVNEAHDETRNLCASCEEVYSIGVQHGRFHEAACYGAKPGRGSAQDPPELEKDKHDSSA